MVLAARGRREGGEGSEEAVEDQDLAHALRRRAFAIGMKATLGAALLTAAAMVP